MSEYLAEFLFRFYRLDMCKKNFIFLGLLASCIVVFLGCFLMEGIVWIRAQRHSQRLAASTIEEGEIPQKRQVNAARHARASRLNAN